MDQNVTNHSDVSEVKKWNWGAFFLGPIWAIGNRVWIGLLALIPIFGIIMNIILGAKGSEWAWKAKSWKSVDHFKSVQRKWAWWGLGVFVLFVIFGLAFGGGDTSNNQPVADKPAVSSPAPAKKPEQPKVAKIGQWVKAGKLEYRVDSVEEKSELKNIMGSKKPSAGNFAILKVSVRNNDKESRVIDSSMMVLKDAQNRSFEPDTDAILYVVDGNDESSFLNEVPPTGTKQITLVYDIRGDVKNYTFHAQSGFGWADTGSAAAISLAK
ncbi:DUF4352 domain-containing protein [Thermoactinomyces daqus]|uniref:DUF4352 domain-containing protein n=1 Tax=Thermoactinomyces daqus TaxID=1329516 RepID=A0A7W1XD64_9BACL|nr:DUF4352 domain-containing protein [Thermoactinomyces daqus]MBA4544388.1 DUF4352 domain-containing protein [Thermoactinomyces daqus]